MKKLVPFLLLTTFGIFAQNGKMKFEIEIKNPNSDSLVISNQTFVKVLRSPDAKFSGNFEIPKGFYQLFDGRQFAFVFLDPDFDLHINSNGSDFRESMTFSGKGTEENNFMLWKKRSDDEWKNSFEGKLPEIAELKTVLEKRIEKAKQKLTQDRLNESFAVLMLEKYRLENLEILEEFNRAKAEANSR